jgi:hypothetical protein
MSNTNSVTITTALAKKAYPILKGGDSAWYDFAESELGIKKLYSRYLNKGEVHANPTYEESSAYYTETRNAKLECRRLYNPIDDAKVGDGVSEHGYSDSRAGTIISRTAKSITVQYDTATLLNPEDLKFHVGGFSAHCSTQNAQKYSYAPNPEAGTVKFTRRKDGSWRNVGAQHVSNRYNDVTLGRREFYDYNF